MDMSIHTLTPECAAEIARGVYFTRLNSIKEIRSEGLSLGVSGLFTVDDDSRFIGRSGGLVACKKLSGFGYIAAGEGVYKNDVLIATRGTETGFDWLTNFNVGLMRGPSGLPVHAGFMDAWGSFRSDVVSFLRGRNPSVIHCVGHSLGGALATLNADHFSSICAGKVKLYTFGSPRVGSGAFVRSLENRIGAENIYRIFHCSDVVPMVPLVPFFHVPTTVPGYQLGNGARGLVSPDAHFMNKSYIPGVSGQSWDALRVRDLSNDHKMNVQLWLEQVSAGNSGVVMGSTWALAMICKALTWLLDKTTLLVMSAVGAGVTAGLTALDYLAVLLAKGANLSKEILGYLDAIVAAIFRFLGRSVVTGSSMTLSFIRWVLGLFYHALAAVAGRALSALR